MQESSEKDSSSTANPFTPRYASKLVSRLILPNLLQNPTIPTKVIAAIVIARDFSTRPPCMPHYCAINHVVNLHMERNRAASIPALVLYAVVMREVGHNLQVFVSSGIEMKTIKVKTAARIFSH